MDKQLSTHQPKYIKNKQGPASESSHIPTWRPIPELHTWHTTSGLLTWRTRSSFLTLRGEYALKNRSMHDFGADFLYEPESKREG
eukprot:scaffold620236_cov20-Prasinocladus_malaysianus.AAC.1